MEEIDEYGPNTVTGNPIGQGYRACGACGTYVQQCSHYYPIARAERIRKLNATKAARAASIDADDPILWLRRAQLLGEVSNDTA